MARPTSSWERRSYAVSNLNSSTFYLTLKGRLLWCMKSLIAAGADGCTPLRNPAPRWSAYVHELRNLGVQIETITEPHGGDYPGHHARYVLRSKVSTVGGVAL